MSVERGSEVTEEGETQLDRELNLEFCSMGSWLGFTPVKNAKTGGSNLQVFKESRMLMATL